MKLIDTIGKSIPEKLLYFAIILGVTGLFVIGLWYGDLTIIFGSVAALIALYKVGIIDKI